MNTGKAKKYITLEDVRVSYDEKTDRIVLTSKDGRLKNLGGLKIDVHSRTAEHGKLKDVLVREGLIDPVTWPKINGSARWELISSSDRPSEKFLVGIDRFGLPVYWDVSKDLNLWVHSDVGASNAGIVRDLVHHCLTHDGWGFLGIGLTGTQQTTFERLRAEDEDDKGLRMDFATNVEETHKMLVDLEALLLERYAMMDALKVSEQHLSGTRLNFSNLPESIAEWNRILLVIDDLRPLMDLFDSDVFSDKVRAMDSMRIVELISRMGRAVGIHPVICTKGTDGRDLLGDDFRQIEFLFHDVVMGRMKRDDLPSRARLAIPKVVGPDHIIGSGTMIYLRDVVGFRSIRSDSEDAIRWLEEARS